MDQTPEPLLAFHILDITQDLPSQKLTCFEPVDGFRVLADALAFSVDEFEAIHEVGAGDGG